MSIFSEKPGHGLARAQDNLVRAARAHMRLTLKTQPKLTATSKVLNVHQPDLRSVRKANSVSLFICLFIHFSLF